MHPYVHCSIIYNNQNMDATWVFIDRWMDKEVVHIYNGILLGYKKNKILPFTTTWMDPEGIVLSEIRQRKTNATWFHLYVESKK